jgi:outer membrane protein insertion porin family
VSYKGLRLAVLVLLFLWIAPTNAQDKIPFDQGVKYILANVDVTGKISFNKQTVVTFAGLEKGQEITIPGEEISNAIKKLGKLGLFNEISFYVNRVENDSIFLDLHLEELPKLNKVRIVGVKKNKIEVLSLFHTKQK